jgi:hypothetical protein
MLAILTYIKLISTYPLEMITIYAIEVVVIYGVMSTILVINGGRK